MLKLLGLLLYELLIFGALASSNFLRCIEIMSQRHLFLYFLPSPFLLCTNAFMDDYDGI
jgi:hypothetical protein